MMTKLRSSHTFIMNYVRNKNVYQNTAPKLIIFLHSLSVARKSEIEYGNSNIKMTTKLYGI